MTIKKLSIVSLCSAVVSLLLLASLTINTGCMTSKTPTVSTNANGTFTTNVVTTINDANLQLDAAALQGVTAISVSLLVSKDPSLIPILKNAQVAIDGILNGSNPTTTAQVLTTLKATGNVALTSEITSLMNTASGLEQSMLLKYGAGVAGKITIALTRAVDGGLIVGLGMTGK